MRTRGWIGRHFRVNLINMKSRGYQMTTRAESTARTADAILDATVAAFRDQPIADITLAEVAERAGVTVQTVLRRFGDKDSVFAAAIERFAHEVFQQRGAAVGLSLPAAVGNLGEHYEQWAPLMLKMLAEEPTTPSLHATLDTGRRYHLSWCEGVFAAALDGLPPGQRARRLAQIRTICDVRSWESLRIHAGLSRTQAELAIVEMLAPLVTKGP